MRKLLIVIVLVSGITLLTPSLAAASKKSDQKLAETATLQQAEVPDGFEEFPIGDAEESALSYACGGPITAASDASFLAPHATTGFTLPESEGYGIITSHVAVLPKTAAAKKALNAFGDEEAAQACVGKLFEELLGQSGVTTEVSVGSFPPELSDKDSTKVIKGGDEFAGFNVSVSRSVEGGEAQFFYAIVVIGRVGRSTVQIQFISTDLVSRTDVQAMAQAVVKRLKPAR